MSSDDKMRKKKMRTRTERPKFQIKISWKKAGDIEEKRANDSFECDV